MRRELPRGRNFFKHDQLLTTRQQCKRKRVSAEVPESDLAPFSRRSPPPRPERRAPTHARARGAAPARRRRQVDQCTVHRLK